MAAGFFATTSSVLRSRVLMAAASVFALVACSAPGGRDLFGPSQPPAGSGVLDESPDELLAARATLSSGSTELCALLEPGVAATDVGAAFGLQIVAQLPGHRFVLFAGPHIAHALLQADRRVELFEENRNISLSHPVDLLMGFHQGDWSTPALARQDALERLHLQQVHSLAQGGGVRVAVLDTGVDCNHPYLASHLSPMELPVLGWCQDTANGVDDDGDGFTDEAYGHGTHVAGLIVTVAPQATVLPLRVLNDDGVGTLFQVAAGLLLAGDLGADIVNLSLVFDGESPLISHLIARLRQHGVVVVAASGNDGAAVQFPASDPAALSVGAVGATDALAEFSARVASLAAPGVGLLSSFPGGGSARGSGTSMACAVTTGVVAVMASAVGSPFAAVERLCAHAAPLSPAGAVRYGRVDPLRALLSRGVDATQAAQVADVAPPPGCLHQ